MVYKNSDEEVSEGGREGGRVGRKRAGGDSEMDNNAPTLEEGGCLITMLLV